jgi:4,5-DOPA dioxygenase extradiol
MTMPALFLSHGAPNLILHDAPVRDFLKTYGKELGRPKAIVIVSAHFGTREAAVVVDEKPGMIYDFGGFEPELYQMQYPAPGAPDLAERVAVLLGNAGIPVHGVKNRGFDHGTWVPLKLLYPDADVPVLQLSVQPNADPDHHLKVGAALAPLRDENILVIGSGSFTHNLGEVFTARGLADPDLPAKDWMNAFREWMDARIAANDTDALVNYRARAPYAERNHPTDEHLLPLYVALGAGKGDKPERIHYSYQYGALALDAYRFG